MAALTDRHHQPPDGGTVEEQGAISERFLEGVILRDRKPWHTGRKPQNQSRDEKTTGGYHRPPL